MSDPQIRHHYYDAYGDRSEAEADVADSIAACRDSISDPEPFLSLLGLAGLAESWAWWSTPLNDGGLWPALKLRGEALVGHFAMACSKPGEHISLTLGGKSASAIGTGPDSTSHAGRWTDAFVACAITRNHAGLDALCAVPKTIFGGSTDKPRERFSAYRWVDALADTLRALWLKSADVGDLLVATLEATDPESYDFGEFTSAVLDLEVPMLELLLRLLERDEAEFNQALHQALELHRRYFTREDRLHDPEGFLAIRPLAMACLAHDTGMQIEIDSPYAPRWIIEHD